MKRQTVRVLFSLLLCFLLFVSPFSALSSYAAGTDDFNASELQYKGYKVVNINGTSEIDITNNVTVSYDYNSLEAPTINYQLPTSSDASSQGVIAFKTQSLKATHEYNLKFGFACGHSAVSSFVVNLIFYDGNGNLIRTQEIYKRFPIGSTGLIWVDVNFVPNVDGLESGYHSELNFVFRSGTGYANTYRLTQTIELNDNDDNSGFFDGILDWLSAIYHGVVGGTDRAGNDHEGIVQGVKNGLVSLGQTISNAIDQISGWLTDVKNGITSALTSVRDSINEKIEGIQVWFVNLKNGIIDGLKSLFIPSDEYLENWKNSFRSWAIDHLGFLYTASSLLSGLISSIRDMLTDSYTFTLPACHVVLPNNDFYLWHEQTVDMSQIMSTGVFVTLTTMYKAMVAIILAFALFKYAESVYNKVMSN